MSYIGSNLQDQSKDCYVEKGVAAQGQTVFNLQRTYTPGTNSLKVYVNGVRQSSSHFSETDNHTVTFASPLSYNDDVLFEIDNLTPQLTVDAGNVPYTLPNGSPSNVSASLDRALSGTGYSFRNLLINGNGLIHQRAAGTTVHGGFPVDRWHVQVVASGAAFSAFQVLNTGVSEYTASHFALQTTTIKTSLAAGDYSMLIQKVEGYISRALQYGTAAAKTSTLSFRAKSQTIDNFVMGVAIRNATGARSYVTSVVLSPTVQRYVITIPGDTSGTWATDNTAGATINFTHSCGTTFGTSSTGTWLAGNYIAPTNQTNGLATLNEAISIGDVQWEVGDVATPFEVVPFDIALTRCQRYWEKSFLYTTAPTQNAGHAYSTQGVAGRATTGQQYININFKVPKRTTPGMTLYNPAAANAHPLDQSSGTSCSGSSILMSGESGATVIFNGSASTAVGSLLSVHWVADSEL